MVKSNNKNDFLKQIPGWEVRAERRTFGHKRTEQPGKTDRGKGNTKIRVRKAPGEK